jgi:Leucine-rich repeat (LRR) protein
MRQQFSRNVLANRAVIGIALIVGTAAVWWLILPAINWLQTFARYQSLATQNNGKVNELSYFPSPSVEVSFESDDLGEHRPPTDMQPLLREFKRWNAVTRLAVEGIHDKEFEEIVAFPNLTSLAMSSTSISDDKWSRVEGLSKLQSLYLQYTNITPAVADAIADLEHLEYLDFYGCKLQSTGLNFVARLHELRDLQFFQRTLGPPLRDEDLTALATLPKLRCLRILNTPLTAGAIARLGNARALETLEISVCWIDANDLSPIAKLPRLKSLNLSSAQITNDLVATLGGSQSIEDLDISGNPIDIDGLRALGSISSLRTITVGARLAEAARRLFPSLKVR